MRDLWVCASNAAIWLGLLVSYGLPKAAASGTDAYLTPIPDISCSTTVSSPEALERALDDGGRSFSPI